MKRFIMLFWALGLVTFLLARTAASSRSVELGDALDFILYGPPTEGQTCLVGEPKDIHSLQWTADAVIRVRLGSRLRPRLLFGTGEAWDLRDATVLEAFKTLGPQPAPGSRIALVEWRGWTAPNTGLVSALLAPFDAIRPSTEWILFVERLPGEVAYQVILWDEGAFQIRDGRISMRTRTRWGAEWDGRPDTVLFESLR